MNPWMEKRKESQQHQWALRWGCRSELETDCLSHLAVFFCHRLSFSGQVDPAGVVPWPRFPSVDSESWHPQSEKVSPGSAGFQSSHREDARTREECGPGPTHN